MQFNSFVFFFFIVIVFLIYWIISDRYRWIVLLLSSYWFYVSWSKEYLIIMLVMTVISYLSALKIEQTNSELIKKALLLFVLLMGLGTLFVFKYYNFFIDSILSWMNQSYVWNGFDLFFQIAMPVGISFYTFQIFGYVIDVYKGNAEAERHMGKYAVFVSFFPQVTSGPIERGRNILPQINNDHFFNYEVVVYGLRLILLGFFKKMVIADNLGIYVDQIYDNLTSYSGSVLIFATVFFSIQIYCDFSGYSDIVIGLARLFDIDLMKNFNNPYFAKSMKEFWSRWHISLSSWFRDYVYIPLGGNRKGKLKQYRNVIITFIISGLWHGANWTFVFWGALHGVFQVIEDILGLSRKKYNRKMDKYVSAISVFILITFAWMFFRVNSLSEVGYIMRNALRGISSPVSYICNAYYAFEIGKKKLIIMTCSIVALLIFDYFNEKEELLEKIDNISGSLRWVIYYAVIFCIIFFAPTTAKFVYFKFYNVI